MAVVSDKDEQHKGQELWKALKKDPLDRRRIRDLIINRAPTNFREPGVETKRTPLHYVIDQRCGDEELLDVLLKHKAGTNLVDSFKMTPLHLAAEKGNLQAVKKLRENAFCPAELRPRNKNGETALEIAQRKRHCEVVSYLLELSGKISIEGDGGVSVFRQVPPLEEAAEGFSISTSFDTYDWGSTKVGLSRVNRELPIQLAKKSVSKETPDAVDNRLAAVSSGGGCEENLFALPCEVVESLVSRSCDPEEILDQLMQNLNLDKTCLKQPTSETTRMIRCFAAKAKISNRIDVVKHLRDIAPAGTIGPLLPGDLDVQNIPHVQIRELTINLSGGEDWKVVAERLGFTAPEIRYLDHRTRNPFEAALAHYIQRNPMKVDDLYDILTECGMPVLADIL